ncbi:MAG: hypothetical protein ACRD29_25470 [Acidimicrobiales bacterium]
MTVLDIAVNPVGLEEEYIDAANRCFGHWGDATTYRWAFKREVGAPAADLLVLRRRGELVAGSAVSYRRLARAGGGDVLVGIMTGSWTLPAARGQGCFTTIIEESRRLTRERGGAALLAFVTRDNASCRRLLEAGGGGVPTSYVYSTVATPPPDGDGPRPEPVGYGDAAVAELLPEWERARERANHFSYATPSAWRGQFLDRPLPVEVLSVGAGSWGVIERADTTDRLLLLVQAVDAELTEEQVLASVLAWTRCRGRQLFIFSMAPTRTAAAARLGLEVKPGLLTVLPADPDWITGPWHLEGGDRI